MNDFSNGAEAGIVSFLEQQLKIGNKWAAYEGFELPDSEFCMEVFASSLDAEKFCSENLFANDPEDGSLISLNYRYHAIENLLAEFRLDKNARQSPARSIEDVEPLLKSLDCKPEYSYDPIRPFVELAHKRIIGVEKKTATVPLEHANAFHIISHHHELNGLIYELGHSTSIVGTFETLQQAEEAFRIKAGQLQPDSVRSIRELHLICSYKGEDMKLDEEGHPTNNSGLALASAGYINGKLQLTELCNPRETWNSYQRFFTRLNEEANQLVVLDDCLNEIKDVRLAKSYWNSGRFTSLINRKLISDAKVALDQKNQNNNQKPKRMRHK